MLIVGCFLNSTESVPATGQGKKIKWKRVCPGKIPSSLLLGNTEGSSMEKYIQMISLASIRAPKNEY